jgi:hypothetical protein
MCVGMGYFGSRYASYLCRFRVQSQGIGDPQAAGAGHLVFPEQKIVLYLQMWELRDATQIDEHSEISVCTALGLS